MKHRVMSYKHLYNNIGQATFNTQCFLKKKNLIQVIPAHAIKTEEPGMLQFTGSPRVGYDLVTEQQ